MKTTNKVLTVFGVTMAVLFLATGASFAASISSPVELAYCHAIERGLAFQCDPAASLQVVNSTSPVIPVTGFAPLAFSTSLRRINEIGLSVDDLSLSDSALALPSAADLSLSDFALSLPGAVATSLRGVNDIALGSTGLSLSDFALSLSGAPSLGLSDFALANPGAVATSLQAANNMMLVKTASFHYGAR